MSSRFRRNGQLILWSYTKHLGINEPTCVGCNAKTRVPTLFCPRNSRSFEGVFKGFLHFFKVSLNIPNELRDSLNQSLNINWTGIAYYILSTLHVHVCLNGHLWLITVYLFIPTLILPLELFCVLSISRLLFFCALTFQ